MKTLIFLLLLICIPAMGIAVEKTIEWPAIPDADGYQLFAKDFQDDYNFSAPYWEGTETFATLTYPDDRQTAVIVRSWKWGVYDLEGNRIKVFSINSNQEIITPEVNPPDPPNIMIRILIAVLDFFVPSSA